MNRLLTQPVLYKKREFDRHRSIRLHWIKYHIEEKKNNDMEIFSIVERDQRKRKDVVRTYIYDKEQKYIVVLEPQKSGTDYYLLSAHFLYKEYGERNMERKLKNKLPLVQ